MTEAETQQRALARQLRLRWTDFQVYQGKFASVFGPAWMDKMTAVANDALNARCLGSQALDAALAAADPSADVIRKTHL